MTRMLSPAEIGHLRIGKIEKKGRRNRRGDAISGRLTHAVAPAQERP